ncbi:alpha/beta hydrolase [[Eubacterium] hominis]|uniref:alpha/beta hydrolase n=1 Tax=[Eubacterium] hominis TaxID=2764325 RepID=UPI003A4DD3B7
MINERIYLNDTAFFDTYVLHQSKEYNVGKKRPLVIVCPGGGYAFTSDREAEPIALKFNSIGLNSVVLWYTVMDQVKNVPRNALIECAQCVKYIREHAEEWLIDTDQIILCGFSAGGHLALSMAVKWNQAWLAESVNATKDQLKVNLAILGYPGTYSKEAFAKDDFGFASALISEPNTANERFFGVKEPTQKDIDEYNLLNFVSEDTPPMFIWHTYEDVLVDVEQSLKLGVVLREKKIPFELHIFEKGEHGLALCDRTTARKASHHDHHVIHWFSLCEEWMAPYIEKEGWKWM